MTSEHPAIAASKASWSAVRRKAKQEWLALFAEDACIEDPIGVSPLDPEGLGQRGKEAIERFWDANIAQNDISFEVHESFAAGSEVANRMTLTLTFPGGATGTVEGVFVYKVDDDGLLESMRGFWELDAMLATLTQ